MKVAGFKHTGNGPKYVKNFFEGGHVTRSPMPEGGNALVQRSKPITDEDRAGGGKTPLRSGFAKGGKAKINIKHPGALHRALNVPQGKKIPAAKIAKAANSGNAHMREMANFAKNAKSFKHPVKKAEGGRVGNLTQALKAAQALVGRGLDADKAAAKAAAVHGVDPKDLSDSMTKTGMKPNPQMLARGGMSRRRGYGSFNRTPKVAC